MQRARAAHVNGIYVLICKKPPYIEPAVGNKTHELFSDDDRDHLGKILIDRFHAKQYDDGLLEAVRYVQSTLNRNDSSREAVPPPAGQRGPDTWSPYGGRRPAAGMGGLSMGLGGCLCVGLVVVGVLALGAMAVSALFRSFGRGPGGYGPGPGGYGGYGPGPGGYGPGGYGGQGGGFLSSILGGLFGGAAGSWAYDRFFGGHSSPNQGSWQTPNDAPPSSAPASDDTSYTAGGGGDFGGGDSGGGDAGGGGDFGGGDAGGGDGGGGGDFGGGGDAGGGGGF